MLCLSREAGAYDELHGACITVHPFDLEQTAAALHEALAMARRERAAPRRASCAPAPPRARPRSGSRPQLRQARELIVTRELASSA